MEISTEDKMKLDKNVELLRQTTINIFNSYFQDICFPIVKISPGTQSKGLDSRSGLGNLDSRSGLGNLDSRSGLGSSSQSSSSAPKPKGMPGFTKGNDLDMNFKSHNHSNNDNKSNGNNLIINNNDNNGPLRIGCYSVLRQIQRATKCLQNLALFQGMSCVVSVFICTNMIAIFVIFVLIIVIV